MKIGAHVSVAGGLHKAVERGSAIGAKVLQIFVSGPQSYRVTEYSNEQIEEFKKLYQDGRFSGLFLHAIYLINLASPDPRLLDLSKASIIHYMKMGEKLRAEGVIVHVGSHRSHPQGGRLQRSESHDSPGVKNAIEEILSNTPKSQKFIIENCAGGKIGKDLDELELLYKQINNERIAFCIDTQHLFASGVDVADDKTFGEWLSEFDKRIGIDKLACVHANDSKTELGSNHDRHENIGMGKIGKIGFTNILSQQLLHDKPFILEVPGVDGKGPDRENIERFKMVVQKLDFDFH